MSTREYIFSILILQCTAVVSAGVFYFTERVPRFVVIPHTTVEEWSHTAGTTDHITLENPR